MEISFEFFPPKSDDGLTKLTETALLLSTLKPEYFSVTFGAGGSTREHTPHAVNTIRKATGINTIPHLSCMGLTRSQLTALLTEYKTNRITNLLVLRGDKPSGSGLDGDFSHASDLVTFIRQQTGNTFHLTVSAYPEPHPESKNTETELTHFVEKIKAGANRAITQYFYNADAYFYFCDRVRARGLDIPIIPGIMPIINTEKLKRFSQFCGAEIPLWILRQLDAYDNPADIKQFGFETVLALCEKLLKGGAPGLHFYTLNMAEPAVALCQALHH